MLKTKATLEAELTQIMKEHPTGVETLVMLLGSIATESQLDFLVTELGA